jgi:hypothetical protein
MRAVYTAAAGLLLGVLSTVATAQEPAPPTAASDGGTQRWSKLTLKPCDPAGSVRDEQLFSVPKAGGAPGTITDKGTGRCLAVLNCKLPSDVPTLKSNNMGAAVLDECGGGSCPADQEWTIKSCTAPSFEITTSASWALLGTYRPDEVGNEGVVLQSLAGCGSNAVNTQFTQLAPAGSSWTQLKIHAAGASGYGTTCPEAGGACCLEALPCVAPCSLPAAWGWAFIIALSVCSALYVGGGVALTSRVENEPLTPSNLPKLLPHVAQWQALGGLVLDGCTYTKARWANRNGVGGAAAAAGYESLPSATGTTEETPSAEKDTDTTEETPSA